MGPKSPTKRTQELREEQIDLLGPKFGELYHALYMQCAFLSLKWDEYEVLFSEDADTLRLLNSVSSLYFGLLQASLESDILLQLCALTAPPDPNSEPAISIQYLVEQAPVNVRELVVEDVAKAVAASHFAHEWHTRKLTHFDYDQEASPIAHVVRWQDRHNIAAAIEALMQPINSIERTYWKRSVNLSQIFPTVQGALSLLDIMRDGLKYREIENIVYS